MSELKRPIQIEEFRLAIKELTDQELQKTKKQINISINKLTSSNQLMQDLLKELSVKQKKASEQDEYEEDTKEIEKDIKLYQDSLNENELVLNNQYERVEALKQELDNRGLSHSTPDLTLAESDGVDASKNNLHTNDFISQDNDAAKDGIYL